MFMIHLIVCILISWSLFFTAMTNAQTRIANTIQHFYDDSAPMGQCGIKYKETVEKLDEEAKKDMVSISCVCIMFSWLHLTYGIIVYDM